MDFSHKVKKRRLNMLLATCLAAVFFCFRATADNVSPSMDNFEGGLKRTLVEVEGLLNENHFIAKRSLTHGVQFVGTGYNYIRGNPEGGKSSHGGIDPGIKTTRRHIKLSATSCSTDGPPEIEDVTHDSCVTKSTNMMFHGTKSYQSNLKIGTTVRGGGDYGLAEYAFSSSALYEEAKTETITTKSVVRDELTVCNRGRIRIKKELFKPNGFSLEDSFVAAVCALPTVYNKAAYMAFIEDYGTHTIFEVELGTRTLSRSKSTLRELFSYAMSKVEASVSASGSYLSHTASLTMDLDTLSKSSTFSSNFKESLYSFTLGSTEYPEPIGYTLETLPAILSTRYWTQLNDSVSRGICPSRSTYDNRIALIRANMKKALRAYPAYLAVTPSEDLPLKIPIAWPHGTYTMVMPIDGCPTSPVGTLFHTGWRKHDTADSKSANKFSPSLKLKGTFETNDLTWHFCTKTVASFTPYGLSWPAGEYCILRKRTCPTGFADGTVKWDDENSNNINDLGGTLPDGTYDKNTIMQFCCRTDGHAENPIYLPQDKPFILLMKEDTCQQVHGMNVLKQYVTWDTEDSHNADENTGSYPYDDGVSNRNHKLFFCYYTKA